MRSWSTSTGRPSHRLRQSTSSWTTCGCRSTGWWGVEGGQDRPVEERRVTLKFIVHLVGDLQQPLHVGDNLDRGGNDTQVRFFDRGSNLHSVWDSGIIERAGREEDFWLTDLLALDSDTNRLESQRGSVEDWASESLRTARQAYEDSATGKRIKSGQRLADTYQDANLTLVRRRLYEGDVRLARVLDEAFSPD